MLEYKLQFEKVFNIAMTSLRMNRAHPEILRNWKFWITQFIPIMIVSVTCAILLIISILTYEIPNGKYADASRNGIMLILFITVTFKYFVLLYYQNSIKCLINIVDADYELAQEFPDEEKLIVLKYAEKGVTVCKFWLVSALATCASFPIKALFLTCYYYCIGEYKLVPMVDLTILETIENHKNYLSVFCSIFVVWLFFDVYATTMHVGFDPLVPIFILHTCGQLELLSIRISKLFVEDCHYSRITEEQLKVIVSKLQEIYKFNKDINANYLYMYEYIMKITIFQLPFTMFQIVENIRHQSINFEFIIFINAVILHFYLPCYYSDLLIEKNEFFKQSIYSCGWEKQYDKSVRQTILLMMTRTATPLCITTVFHPMCLDTFAEMCRQSYTIFNLMNAAWS